MRKITLILASILVLFIIIPVTGFSLPDSSEKLYQNIGDSEIVGEDSLIKEIKKVGNDSRTFITNIGGDDVGISLGDDSSDSDGLRIESEGVAIEHDDSLKANIKGNMIDFSDGPLRVEDVYDLSERQEEIVSPGEDMEDGTIIQEEPIEKEIIDEE